jgi:hypothetical protein
VKAVRPDLDDTVIRRYLLGFLPEEEAEALEEAYLAHPEVWERVRGVEDDLLDDHASGRLGPGEKGAFESRYLAFPRLRERVVAARALRMARADARVPPARVVAARPTRWRVPLAIAAGLLLAVVGLSIWPSPAPPRTATSAPPTPATGSQSPVPPVSASMRALPGPTLTATFEPGVRPVVLALSPVLLRGEDRPVELRVPRDADTVVLELEGDPAILPRPARALEASIKTVEGKPVWRGEARRVSDARRPSLLATARVPAARLVPGDYLVTMSARGSEDTLHSYFFRAGR